MWLDHLASIAYDHASLIWGVVLKQDEDLICFLLR